MKLSERLRQGRKVAEYSDGSSMLENPEPMKVEAADLLDEAEWVLAELLKNASWERGHALLGGLRKEQADETE